MVDEKIGKYRIVERIGRGGMGMIFKAHDPILDRLVALKVIAPEVEVTDELRVRFFREAQACAKLNHPNIVTVYELGEAEGRLFIVMELLEGQELRRLIALRPPLTLEDKLSVMTQVCGGLHYAHQKGIVHRDMKPGNVFLLGNGRVKILDFGIAQMAAAGDGLTLTRTGLIMGTLRYISPEQLRGHADHRSDMFSVGSVFYELLTLRPAFTGEDPAQLLEQLRAEDPPPASEIDAGIPLALTAIVQRAMRKNPAERFGDLEEMRVALEQVQRAVTEERQRVAARVRGQGERLVQLQGQLAALLGAAAEAEPIPPVDERRGLAAVQALERTLAARLGELEGRVAEAEARVAERRAAEQAREAAVQAQQRARAAGAEEYAGESWAAAETKLEEGQLASATPTASYGRGEFAEAAALYRRAEKAAVDARERVLEVARLLEEEREQREQAEADGPTPTTAPVIGPEPDTWDTPAWRGRLIGIATVLVAVVALAIGVYASRSASPRAPSTPSPVVAVPAEPAPAPRSPERDRAVGPAVDPVELPPRAGADPSRPAAPPKSEATPPRAPAVPPKGEAMPPRTPAVPARTEPRPSAVAARTEPSTPPAVARTEPRAPASGSPQDVARLTARVAAARQLADQSAAGFWVPQLLASPRAKEQRAGKALERSDHGEALRLLGEAEAEYRTAAEQARAEAEAERKLAPARERVKETRAAAVLQRTEALTAQAGRLAREAFETAEATHLEADALDRRHDPAAAAKAYESAAAQYKEAARRARAAR